MDSMYVTCNSSYCEAPYTQSHSCCVVVWYVSLKPMLRRGNLSVAGPGSFTNVSLKDLNTATEGLNEALKDP